MVAPTADDGGEWSAGPSRPRPSLAPGAGGQRPYVATTGQVWALPETVADHLRPAILLGAFVGPRTAEVVGLRVWDVDSMRGVVPPVQLSAAVARWAGTTSSPTAPAGSGLDVEAVEHRLRQGSATTTLDTYGHLWPDSDESTRLWVLCWQLVGTGWVPSGLGTRQPSLPTLGRLLAAVDLDMRVRLEPYDDHDDVLDHLRRYDA